MWDLCTNSLDTAGLRGASYGDARLMHLRQRDLTTKNGRVGTLSQSESIGLGIRVLADGAWGFASTDRLTREGVAACAAQAVSLAKASALAKRSNVVLVPEQEQRCCVSLVPMPWREKQPAPRKPRRLPASNDPWRRNPRHHLPAHECQGRSIRSGTACRRGRSSS